MYYLIELEKITEYGSKMLMIYNVLNVKKWYLLKHKVLMLSIEDGIRCQNYWKITII
jgi:hypothetical protein